MRADLAETGLQLPFVILSTCKTSIDRCRLQMRDPASHTSTLCRRQRISGSAESCCFRCNAYYQLAAQSSCTFKSGPLCGKTQGEHSLQTQAGSRAHARVIETQANIGPASSTAHSLVSPLPPAQVAMAPRRRHAALLAASAAAVGPGFQQLPDEVLVRILGCLSRRER